MADILKKVKAGDDFEIPADTYNAFVDAARTNRDRKQKFETLRKELIRNATVFPIRNTTGAAVNRFEILGIDDPIFDPSTALDEFHNRIAFDGSLPAEEHRGRFCILLEPAPDDALAKACYAGVCITQVEIFEDEFQIPFADIKLSTKTQLIQDRDGAAQILWHEPGTGVVWAIVRLGRAAVEFWAEITGNTEISPGTNRWDYDWKEMSLNIGTNTWSDHPQQRTGTARNTIEIPNTGSGIEGNGVDLDSLIAPTLWPAGTGAIVRMHEWFKGTSEKEHWFTFENSVTDDEGHY